jgi:hypothetical protein
VGKREEIKFPYPEGDFFDEGLPKGVISPSGFNMYRRCPRQFYYAYVLAQIRPPEIAMIKGTAIHKGAEVIHKHTIETQQLIQLDAVKQQVSDTFDAELEDIESAKEKKEAGPVKDDAISNVAVYYTQAVPLIVPVAAEEPFAVKIGTVPVRGVIDLIDKKSSEWDLPDETGELPQIEVVADLKTTTKMWTQQKLEYEPQLTFYACVKNTPYTRVDFLLDQKKGITYSPQRMLRSKHDIDILTEDLEETVHLIKQGAFPRCDPTHWVCTASFCGYFNACKGPK